jgi:hypothetical protein
MDLPPDLRQAISSTGGAKVALVLGAGCSVEAPTGLPVSSSISQEIHRLLVADGVLKNGDCTDPTDLSLVADAVFCKTHSQRAVVERFRERYDLKLATPNRGYYIAAAMLCEGAISSVVTLNFDLALSTALSELGAGQIVGVVERPEDLPLQKAINIYYLHRNVNAADPELWVLRTAALAEEWRGHWEPIIANRVLTAPVVVFAGLGTPVAVLIESTRLLREALMGTRRIYQADPGEREDSKFFGALNIDPAAYLQCGWGELMEEFSRRLSLEQVAQLRDAIDRKVREDRLEAEDVSCFVNRFESLGLVKLGKLRASWLLHDKPYCPVDSSASGLLADLVLALAMLARVSGALPVVADDGVVEFHRDGQAVSSYLIASGRGYRGRPAIEARIESRSPDHRSRAAPPRGVLVGGTSDAWDVPTTPPKDILQGDQIEEDLVSGPMTLPLIHIDELRRNQDLIQKLVPWPTIHTVLRSQI